MQIDGLSLINLFRSEEVINIEWQTFSSKVRQGEELEIWAGGGELKTHALSEGLGHLYILKNACQDSELWQLWKDPCPEGLVVARHVPHISWVVLPAGSFPGGTRGKDLPADAGDMRHGLDPWVEKILWRRAWHPSSILALRIPWTEEPGGLWSIGSYRVGHNWSNLARTQYWESVGYSGGY